MKWRKFMKKTVASLFFLLLVAVSSISAEPEKEVAFNETGYDYSAEHVTSHLIYLNEFLYSFYAPLDWKQHYFNWSLTEEMVQAEGEIQGTQAGDIRSFQKIFRGVLESLQDFHVSFYTASWGSSSLPFRVKSVDDQYFVIDVIPNGKLEGVVSAGDELVSIDGLPTFEYFKQLDFLRYSDNPNATTKALGDDIITFRSFESGFKPEYGNAELTFKLKNGRVKTVLVPWYTINQSIDYNLHEKNFLAMPNFSKKKPQMVSPIAGKLSKEIIKSDGSWSIGTWESYVPQLGRVIWNSPNKVESYIFETPDGHHVGVLRIPTYDLDALMFEMKERQADLFDDLFGDLFDVEDVLEMYENNIDYLQANTDALIIDQVSNPGGNVGFMYWLLAHLTDRELDLPNHYQVIDPELVYDAQYILSFSKQDHLVQEVEAWIGPYELNLSDAPGIIDGAKKAVKGWNQMKRLSDPYPLLGIEKIRPARHAAYTKPLFVLTDELDFSCADFFPAILKDNSRATIVGTNTAGAGGCVSFTQYPNRLGFLGFTYTYTISERSDKRTIENLGVTPDYEIKITAQDLKSDFSDYKNKLVDFIDRKLAE